MLSEKPLSELNLSELLEKAKVAQTKMKAAQARLASATVIGVAGDKDVEIKITGKYQAVNTSISSRVMADKDKLGNLVTTAINDAFHKLDLITKE